MGDHRPSRAAEPYQWTSHMPAGDAPRTSPDATGRIPRHLKSAIEEGLDHGRRIAVELVDSIGEAAAASWFHEHEQHPLHMRRDCPLLAR